MIFRNDKPSLKLYFKNIYLVFKIKNNEVKIKNRNKLGSKYILKKFKIYSDMNVYLFNNLKY